MYPSDNSSHAIQASSLVLVAPMPRRPIALVNRRHHHHSRSRSSRTVSNGNVAALGPSPLPPSPESIEHRTTSPTASHTASTVRLVAHPYSRAKTPSNANAHVTSASPGAIGWPHGLGISPVSPPPRSRNTSRDGYTRPPSVHRRLSSRDPASLAAAVGAETVTVHKDAAQEAPTQVDDPMLASPVAGSATTSTVSMMGVERTPTKRNSRVYIEALRSPLGNNASAHDIEDQEPRSTPTLGATSPHADGQGLTLSPVSPTQQRITAVAAACSALPLTFSSPSAPVDAADADQKSESRSGTDAVHAVAGSVAPSPSLSESHSRSPTASPSPCPSPFGALLEVGPLKHAAETLADQPRRTGLPPIPTSPIPRKMTRNPFERYISVGTGCSGSMTLHARLQLAMAQSGKPGNLVVQAMEAQASSNGEEADEEMGSLDVGSPSLASHRPALVSVDSSGSLSSRMDMDP